VYLFSAEQAALEAANGDVSAALKSVAAPADSPIPAEVRMLRHLVLQDAGCSSAVLTNSEAASALQERPGNVQDAAKRLTSNPIIVQRSLVASVQQAAEAAVPFATIAMESVVEALNATKNDGAATLQTLIDGNSGKESVYRKLQEILTSLGCWKSKVELTSALSQNDFSVEAAAAALSGIHGTSTTTWCKGEPSVIEAYKRAAVAASLGEKLKFCTASDGSIEVALSLSHGAVAPAVEGLMKEWLGQQMVLQTKAHIMDTGLPWADIASEDVKAALQEHGARDPAMAALKEKWEAQKPLYDELCAALAATKVVKTDAEICAAMVAADFDAAAASLALTQVSARSTAVSSSGLAVSISV
jgi:hypothetical protein